MKYDFDTILKDFKPVKEENIEESNVFGTCMALITIAGIIQVISMFI